MGIILLLKLAQDLALERHKVETNEIIKPHYLNIAKAIDGLAKAERQVENGTSADGRNVPGDTTKLSWP